MLIHFIAMNNVQGIESARSHWRIRILLPKIQINILHIDMSKGKCETGQFWPLIRQKKFTLVKKPRGLTGMERTACTSKNNSILTKLYNKTPKMEDDNPR